jgi:hypothetical protein
MTTENLNGQPVTAVKRYVGILNGEPFTDPLGVFVMYADYAQLERRLTAAAVSYRNAVVMLKDQQRAVGALVESARRIGKSGAQYAVLGSALGQMLDTATAVEQALNPESDESAPQHGKESS